MKYTTTRFGSIEVEDDEIVSFPEGLYGFETESKFAILPFDPNIDCPLKWLQSLTTPDLAFVVTDPEIYVPNYKLILTPIDRNCIQIEAETSPLAFVIATIPTDYRKMTGNLVAPIVINPKNRFARQIVLTAPEYDTRHLLIPTGILEPSVNV